MHEFAYTNKVLMATDGSIHPSADNSIVVKLPWLSTIILLPSLLSLKKGGDISCSRIARVSKSLQHPTSHSLTQMIVDIDK